MVHVNVPWLARVYKICTLKFEVRWIHDTLWYLNQNIQAVKKECGPQKGQGEKRCEIQGGGQEMVVMVG